MGLDVSEMIVAEGLTWRAGGREIVDSVSLSVGQGELVAIVGPNGAGKSTLVALLAGDLRPARGRAAIAGREIQRTNWHEMALVRAVMPQHTEIRFPFTVREVVMMGRHPHQGGWGSPSTEDRGLVEDAMRNTRVWELRDRVYRTLSGGEQRRTALARTFAQGASVMLLDEPTNSLDIRHQELVMTLCRKKVDEGCTVLVVLHDLNLAASYADRIVAMKDGRVAATGTPGEVCTEAFLSGVFDHPVVVMGHPCTGRPVVLPDSSCSAEQRELRIVAMGSSLWRGQSQPQSA